MDKLRAKMWNQYFYDIHTVCISQLENVRYNLDVFMDNNFADLPNEANATLDAYIESLINVSNLSRKFVLQVMRARFKNNKDFPAQCGNIRDNAQIMLRSPALPVSVEAYDNKIQKFPPGKRSSILQIEDSKSDHDSCDTLHSQDLSKYESGYILNAAVTFIKDLKELKFCAWDRNNEELQSIKKLSCSLHMRQFTGLPAENEIFGVVLDEKILRALLRKSHTSTNDRIENSSYTVQLIDFGEVVDVDLSYITYRLLPEHKRIPPQALSCHLHSIEADKEFPQIEQQTLLEELVYKTPTFEVVSVKNGVLELKLLQTSIENKPLEAFKGEKQHTVEPPGAKTQETPLANSKPKKVETNPFLDTSEDGSGAGDSLQLVELKKLDRSIIPKSLSEREGLTTDEWELLHEEPECTSNATKAVHGYVSKDDKRLCQFYNPKTGNCFKGSNCRLEHTPPNSEGLTKDKVPAASIAYNRNPTVRYSQGDIINITPTCVTNMHCFYAQVNNSKAPMMPNIWFDDEVPQHKRLKTMPLMYEVVLAKYDDGSWYRARVDEAEHGSKEVLVFYIDYGNHQRIPLHDCARCDDAVAHLPCQADLFFISSVDDYPKMPEQRERATNMLLEAILNTDLNVEVVNQYEDITIRFLDKRVNEVLNSMKKLFS